MDILKNMNHDFFNILRHVLHINECKASKNKIKHHCSTSHRKAYKQCVHHPLIQTDCK